MAEVKKSIKKEKGNLKNTKVVVKSKNTGKTKKDASKTKKSLWAKFMIFCNGVKEETLKVHWTNKKDMVKYSVATICFVIFCSLFFYLIDVLFALVQSLFN